MGKTLVASSPESVPSLAALSQASTDGDDSLRLASESPAAASSIELVSWRAIVDDDEDDIHACDDKLSQCSSGILSSDTLDISMDAKEVESLHSLSSMKTIKSPRGRLAEDPSHDTPGITDPVEFKRVDTEDIPVHRACHGALGISPKQLADVFALFSKESKPKEPAEETNESQHTILHEDVPAPSPVPTLQQDYPVSMEERYRYRPRGARQPKLTAELYWKPRAKSLEKECQTLKEILSDDSNKILQLKGALETLRSDKLRSLVEIKSFQDQLESAHKEVDTLKKEREIILEHQTEYRETIRILKHEVDLLTRDQQTAPDKAPAPVVRNAAEQDELEQLRLENQLFATQIVDYEAELERLEQQVKATAGKEQQDTLEALRAMELAQSISRLEQLNNERSQETEHAGHTLGADSSDLEGNVPCLSKEPSSEDPSPENVETTLSNEESMSIVVAASSAGEKYQSFDEDDGLNSIADEKTIAEEEGIRSIPDGKASDEHPCKEPMSSVDGEERTNEVRGRPNEFPQQILGNVLGMFSVGGSTDDGKENAKDEIFVLHEAVPTHPASTDEVHCLQWNSPDQLPTFVKMDKIVPIEKVEDRNPPSTSSQGVLGDKTNHSGPSSMRSILKQHEESRCGGRDDTAIEVLQNSDASQSIEVHLTNPEKDKPRSAGVKVTCDDDCDLWNALSNCPFGAESQPN